MLQRDQLVALYVIMSGITGMDLTHEQNFKNWACFVLMIVMIFVVIAVYWGKKHEF